MTIKEVFCKRCNAKTLVDGRQCSICRSFVKGVSGNPAGRNVNKVELSDEDKAVLQGFDSPYDYLMYEFQQETNVLEKKKLANKLLEYDKPKLKSVELKQTQDININFGWAVEDKKTGKHQLIEEAEFMANKIVDVTDSVKTE